MELILNCQGKYIARLSDHCTIVPQFKHEIHRDGHIYVVQSVRLDYDRNTITVDTWKVEPATAMAF